MTVWLCRSYFARCVHIVILEVTVTIVVGYMLFHFLQLAASRINCIYFEITTVALGIKKSCASTCCLSLKTYVPNIFVWYSKILVDFMGFFLSMFSACVPTFTLNCNQKHRICLALYTGIVLSETTLEVQTYVRWFSRS